MASRRLEDLQPQAVTAARQHIAKCQAAGIELLVYCTVCDAEEQALLYRQGRTAAAIELKKHDLLGRGFPALAALLDGGARPGGIVTNAGPGESFHQYGLAYDCVPLVGGKPAWSTAGANADLWRQVGDLGNECGLEWAGKWTKFREFPHFQLTGGAPLETLMHERYGGSNGGA